MKRVYLICPVRIATPEELAAMQQYVDRLESGGYKVHYPPRDVDQSNDDGGIRICQEHREAMASCDEVHVWWNNRSGGSHFDLGMAFMLNSMLASLGKQPLPVVLAKMTARVAEKSFQNVLCSMAEQSDTFPR